MGLVSCCRDDHRVRPPACALDTQICNGAPADSIIHVSSQHRALGVDDPSFFCPAVCRPKASIFLCPHPCRCWHLSRTSATYSSSVVQLIDPCASSCRSAACCVTPIICCSTFPGVRIFSLTCRWSSCHGEMLPSQVASAPRNIYSFQAA